MFLMKVFITGVRGQSAESDISSVQGVESMQTNAEALGLHTSNAR